MRTLINEARSHLPPVIEPTMVNVSESALSKSMEILEELRELVIHGEAESKGELLLIDEFYELCHRTIHSLNTMFNFESISTTDPAPPVMGAQIFISKKHLIQALENILENAKKGGASKIIFSIDEQSNKIQLNIADNGRGIKQTLIEQISWGYTSGGSGIGTQIIRENIQRAGGSVLWNSIEGIGTRVTITLRKERNGYSTL